MSWCVALVTGSGPYRVLWFSPRPRRLVPPRLGCFLVPTSALARKVQVVAFIVAFVCFGLANPLDSSLIRGIGLVGFCVTVGIGVTGMVKSAWAGEQPSHGAGTDRGEWWRRRK